MSSTDLKSLKKLAETCRKVGISHFKGPEFEFTLTSEVPISEYKKKKEEMKSTESVESLNEISSDTISDDALLFWSSVDDKELTGQKPVGAES